MITQGLVDPAEAVLVEGPSEAEAIMPSGESVPARKVPRRAYLAADRVMDYVPDARDADPEAQDELWLALGEAAPHIRIDEIDRLREPISRCRSVEEVLTYLASQREHLNAAAELS